MTLAGFIVYFGQGAFIASCVIVPVIVALAIVALADCVD